MKFEVVVVGELKPDFVSRHIQRYQSAVAGKPIDYSHAAIIVDGKRVFDATGRGIGECTLEELLDKGEAVIRRSFEVKVMSECCALTWLTARRGLGYSNLQYIGFLFPFLRALPFVRNGRKRTVCSEFVADFLCDWSIYPKQAFDNGDFLLPMDIVNRLEFFCPPISE